MQDGSSASKAIPAGSNRGMLASTLDRIARGPSADEWCQRIIDYINDSEEDRLARTGYRRLPGFEK